jgi:hypothetical protein
VNTSNFEVALDPPAVLTVTSMAPVYGGLVALRVVLLTTVTEAAGLLPKATIEPDVKPLPVTVTTVPPANGPADGLTAVTVGTASKVNTSKLEVALDPPAVVTVTSTAPVPAGLVTVSDVGLVKVTEAAVVPNNTVEPKVNPEPVTVTTVPPTNGPSSGLTAVTDGTASKVNTSNFEVALDPPPVVTVTSTAPVPPGLVTVSDVLLT